MDVHGVAGSTKMASWGDGARSWFIALGVQTLLRGHGGIGERDAHEIMLFDCATAWRPAGSVIGPLRRGDG